MAAGIRSGLRWYPASVIPEGSSGGDKVLRKYPASKRGVLRANPAIAVEEAEILLEECTPTYISTTVVVIERDFGVCCSDGAAPPLGATDAIPTTAQDAGAA